MQHARHRRSMCRRRGSTFAVALWVITALVGIVLVLGHSVRVEAIAAANRLSRMQADAAARGAEQWLVSVVEQEIATPGTAATILMEGVSIGECGVWVITPDPGNPEQFAYGLTDEAGKIDLNTATADMLLKLPGMKQECVDAIIDWRDSDSTETGQGAESAYYLGGNEHGEAYSAKNSDFESVDELLLVRWMTPELLFNADRNRNGVVDARETVVGGMDAANVNNTQRGIYPFVTVYGMKATGSTTAATTGGSGGGGVADVNSTNQTRLRTVLQNAASGKVESVLDLTRTQRPFANIFDWYFKVGLTQDEFAALFTQVTANPVATGPGPAPAAPRVAKVNVFTAPREVLACLPSLELADADEIIARRPQLSTGANPADLSWLVGVLTREKLAGTGSAVGMGSLVTGTSKVYSGDIVAVSPDGRAFRRVRVVIDGRSTPPKIIYRRDMTASGWPLPPEIRASFRAGDGASVMQRGNTQL